MPRVFTRKAKFDTYRRGLRIEDESTKSGERIDRSKPADEHDELFCKKGEKYYTWSFRYGGTHKSLQRPRQSQLTQSEFLSAVYDAQERCEDVAHADSDTTSQTVDDLVDTLDEIMSDIESAGDEAQSSFDNMPDGLQEGDTGQLLEARAQYAEEMRNEVETLHDRVVELQGEIEERCKKQFNDDEDAPLTKSECETLDSIVDEINSISYDGE